MLKVICANHLPGAFCFFLTFCHCRVSRTENARARARACAERLLGEIGKNGLFLKPNHPSMEVKITCKKVIFKTGIEGGKVTLKHRILRPRLAILGQ